MAENKSTLATLQDWSKDSRIIQRFGNTIGGGTASEKANRGNQFLNALVTIVGNNSLFVDCEPHSIMRAALQVAALDLSIHPSLGQAAIIPFKDKGVKQAQLQIMVRGIVELAMRSGQVRTIRAFTVYEDEYNGYDKIRGSLRDLKPHRNSCKKVHGYGAYVCLSNGGENTEYMTLEEVRNHAKRFSKAYNNDISRNSSASPWSTSFDAMAEKTVLKRLVNKYVPKSIQMQMALNADQAIITDASPDGKEFTYAYQDNPNNDFATDIEVDVVEDQYTPEEQKKRDDALDFITAQGITLDQLLTYYKVEDISQIPTDKLVEKAESFISKES